MIKNILVCLEASASSQRAVAVSIELALELAAGLVGLAVIDEPHIRAPEPTPIGGSAFKAQRDESLVADAEQHARAWLEAFLAACRAVGVDGRALEVHGAPLETILGEGQLRDLTVFGRDANFRYETDAHDPQTRDAILRGAGKPVLVVPAEPVQAGDAILCAYDGTQASIRALRALATSGLCRDRSVHVVSVGDAGPTAWEVAQRGASLLSEHDVVATPHHVVSLKSVAESLLELREKLGAGLLVQGAYAHSRFSRLLWGSVTQEMLEKTPVPLFLHY